MKPKELVVGFDDGYGGAGALLPLPNNCPSPVYLFKNGLFWIESFFRNGFARTSEIG